MDNISEQENSKKKNRISISWLVKKASKNLILTCILLFMTLTLILFDFRNQTLHQYAATPSTTGTNECSNVPFYCFGLGGLHKCIRPKACPTLPPQPGFVAQGNPSPSIGTASNPNNPNNPGISGTISSEPATKEPNGATCTGTANVPAILTTPLLVHFDLSEATIRSVDMSALNKYAAALKSFPKAIVTIKGYTDAIPFVPNTGTNQALSLDRAIAAKQYLISVGASKNTYVVNGYGATNFVAPNLPTTGNLLNRRDVITTNLKPLTCSAAPKCSDEDGNSGLSGYSFNPISTATKMSVYSQWKVPKTTCPANAKGVGMYSGVETNNETIVGGSLNMCNPTITYVAYTEAAPQPVVPLPATDTISAGDTVSSTVTMNSKGSFTTVVKDSTKGWSYTLTQQDSGFKSLSPADAGQLYMQDIGGNANPLLNFGTSFQVSNSQYSVNGATDAVLAKAPGLACVNMARNGTVLDNVSKVSSGNFTQAWKQQ